MIRDHRTRRPLWRAPAGRALFLLLAVGVLFQAGHVHGDQFHTHDHDHDHGRSSDFVGAVETCDVCLARSTQACVADVSLALVEHAAGRLDIVVDPGVPVARDGVALPDIRGPPTTF